MGEEWIIVFVPFGAKPDPTRMARIEYDSHNNELKIGIVLRAYLCKAAYGKLEEMKMRVQE